MSTEPERLDLSLTLIGSQEAHEVLGGIANGSGGSADVPGVYTYDGYTTTVAGGGTVTDYHIGDVWE